ncbi:MAG: hypothetical protein HQM09_22685 [Candidatus Riflebacteria bacterium]|nr:hypothetical protein [Candidatus Riflebacteria bacterium]
MMNPVELRKLRDWAPLPFVITVIMFFAPGFIIAPVEDNLAASWRAFDQNIKAASDLVRKRTDDREMTERNAKLREGLSRMDRWLPPADFLPNVIDEMNKLAKASGVRLTSVNYGFDKAVRSTSGNGSTMPPRISILLRLRADYAAMRAFLLAIESLPFPLLPIEIVAGENREFTIEILHFVRP